MVTLRFQTPLHTLMILIVFSFKFNIKLCKYFGFMFTFI